MRDYERLEELSGMISAGLEAGEVVLAVDQLLGGRDLDEDGRRALATGAYLLRQIADPDADFATPSPARQSLMSTGTALDALEVVQLTAPTDVAEFLNRMAEAMEAAADATPRKELRPHLCEALQLFSLLGEVELARANKVARTGKEPMTWLSSKTTSPS